LQLTNGAKSESHAKSSSVIIIDPSDQDTTGKTFKYEDKLKATADTKKTGINCRVVIDCDEIKILPAADEANFKTNGKSSSQKQKKSKKGQSQFYSNASSGILYILFF